MAKVTQGEAERGEGRWRCLASVQRGLASQARVWMEQDLQGRLVAEARALDRETPSDWLCPGCNSQRSAWRRNGQYQRQLQTEFGVLTLRVPRWRCGRCGGSIRTPWTVFRRRQRLWHDLVALTVAGSAWRMSYRAIQELTSRFSGTPPGRKALLRWVQRVDPPLKPLPRMPTEIAVDGLPTRVWEGQRRHKHRRDASVLVAVDQSPGRDEPILAVVAASGEAEGDYATLGQILYDRGLRTNPAHPLTIVSDGAPGIAAGLAWAVPHRRHQRCLWHVAGNVRDATPEPLRPAVLADYWRVVHAPCWDAAATALGAFIHRYRRRAPEAVQTLTAAFGEATTHLQSGAASLCQTTNGRVERMNREFRRKLRQVEAFRAAASVQPTLALIVARCNGRATGRPWLPPLVAAVLRE